jgi:hypothetical protein
MLYNTQNHYDYGIVFKVQSLRLALSKEPNRVGVSLSSHDDGNRSSFLNVVFSSYLELKTMDKVHNPVILRLYN